MRRSSWVSGKHCCRCIVGYNIRDHKIEINVDLSVREERRVGCAKERGVGVPDQKS